MSQEETYLEAKRYLKNAFDILSEKGNKKEGYYQDKKYVRMACGTAYNGVLLAIDCWLEK